MAEPYIRDAWYAVASADEALDSRPLRREILGSPLVIFRNAEGAAVALLDRCPHRHAPLSMGPVEGGEIACPYHGMRFDGTGTCTRIPGQQAIPSAARVRSFPCIERYGLVFAWMGDPALARPQALIDIAPYDDASWGRSRGYALFEACWQNIVDNLLDPAHTSFVHQRTIGNDAGEDVPVKARLLGDRHFECGRWLAHAPAVPVVRRFTSLTDRADRWQSYHFEAPCTSWVDFGALPAGSAQTEEAKRHAPYRVLSYAFLTPRTATSTHYFSFQLRNFAADDESVTAEFNALYKATFEEDRALLEAIQRAEDAPDGSSLKPLRIASDVGVVRWRQWWAEQMT